nr:S8 family serine peptidase [Marinobacter fonticola]
MSKKAGTTATGTKKDLSREPIFRLPPYTVHNIFVGLSEIQDWGLKLLNIPSLWRISEGEGVKVAILDTGVSLNHPDLTGSIPAGNYKDFTNSPHGIADQQGHGTHCAGIVAARKNSRGVVGVAPKAELLIGKVLGDDGSGTGENIAAGVNWAVEQGADIISMSLGAQMDVPMIHAPIRLMPTSNSAAPRWQRPSSLVSWRSCSPNTASMVATRLSIRRPMWRNTYP